MSLLLPGVQGQRRIRASRLLFGWRAADVSLVAYTGQVGTFTSHATNRGTVAGLNNVSFLGGRGMPRFTAPFDALSTITRLRLQGDTAGTYDERVQFPFNLPVQPLTVYVKLRSLYTLATGGIASPGNFALALGSGTTTGGRLTLARSTGGVWRATRAKAVGGSVELTVTETGAWVHPFELLVSLNANGSITFSLRDGSGAVRALATSAADADLIVLTEAWDQSLLHFGPGAFGVERGGEYDYESCKIAAGVKTFAEIDTLG